MWILVLEDNDWVRRSLLRTIEQRTDVEVHAAQGLSELFQLLSSKSEPPSVAILDLDLGTPSGGDGVTALVALRERGLGDRCAFFTADPLLLPKRLAEAGVEDELPCFSKPDDLTRLADWVTTRV